MYDFLSFIGLVNSYIESVVGNPKTREFVLFLLEFVGLEGEKAKLNSIEYMFLRISECNVLEVCAFRVPLIKFSLLI